MINYIIGSTNMANTLLTKEQVLEKIGAKDFRSINQQQLISFVSSLPEMDKEVALECIKQFPELGKQTNNILTILKDSSNELAKGAKEINAMAIDSINRLIDSLDKALNNPNLSDEQIMIIVSKEYDLAKDIKDIANSNQSFIQKMNDKLVAVGALGLVLAAGALGVKVYKDHFL